MRSLLEIRIIRKNIIMWYVVHESTFDTVLIVCAVRLWINDLFIQVFN